MSVSPKDLFTIKFTGQESIQVLLLNLRNGWPKGARSNGLDEGGIYRWSLDSPTDGMLIAIEAGLDKVISWRHLT